MTTPNNNNISGTPQLPASSDVVAGPPNDGTINQAKSKEALPTRIRRPVDKTNTVTDALTNELFGIVSLEALLAEAEEEFAVVDEREGANVSVPKENRIPELSIDGLNEDRYGNRDVRRTNNNTGDNRIVNNATPANVTHVPICDPRPADSVDHQVQIVRDVQYTDNTLRDMTNLVRGANTDARREGSLASSIIAVIDPQEAAANSAPLMGLTTRVAQAVLAASTGATASPAPNIPDWDVITTALNQVSLPMANNPRHFPLYIPKDMPPAAAFALASLVLPGGAAAYTWRYREPDDPRATLMPSYARFLHPGGTSQIIVIFEKVPRNIVYGGAALTVPALTALEAYYRRHFGNLYFDHAYRAMAMAGHVYVEPLESTRDYGDSFSPVIATTTHGGIDLAGATCLWTPQHGQQHSNVAFLPWTDPRGVPHELESELARALIGLRTPPAQGQPDNRQGVGPVPRGNARMSINWDANDAVAVWEHQGLRQRATATVDEVLVWWAANQPVMSVVNYVVAVQRQEQHTLLITDFAPEDAEKCDVELVGFRNAYGYNDASVPAMPEFDLRRTACLIAKVHKPMAYGKVATNIPSDTVASLRTRMRRFVLKAHIASMFVCASKNFWPDDFLIRRTTHDKIVADMPRGLSSLCYIVDADRTHLTAPNWQILEPVNYLKGGGMATAYYNFDVAGTWATDDNGRVEVNTPDSAYPALDAAIRLTWLHRGTIDVVTPVSVDFAPVIALNGVTNPLGISPITNSGRRSAGVAIIPGLGVDIIGMGRNRTADVITTY